MKACCNGCSVSPLASPSTVRIGLPLRLHREHQAGAHRLAVEDDGAGAADAVLAADMRAGLAAVVADRIDQRLARLDADVVLAAVDRQRDVDFIVTASVHFGSMSPNLLRTRSSTSWLSAHHHREGVAPAERLAGVDHDARVARIVLAE